VQQLVALIFASNTQIIISVCLIGVERCKTLLFSRKMLVEGGK